MALAIIESKPDIEKRKEIEARLDAGELPKPPPKDPQRPYHAGLGEAGPSTREDRMTIVEADKARQEHEAEMARWKAVADAYDPSCGMDSHKAFVTRLFLAMYDDFILKYVGDHSRCGWKPMVQRERLLIERETKAREIVRRVMQKRADGYWTKPLPATPAQVAALQSPIEAAPKSNEELLMEVAEARTIIPRAVIDQFCRDVTRAVAHPNAPEHHSLAMGCMFQTGAFEYRVIHPAIERQLVVASRLDLKEKQRPVFKRGEARDFLIEVKQAVAAKQVSRSRNQSINAVVKVVVEQMAAARRLERATMGPMFDPKASRPLKGQVTL